MCEGIAVVCYGWVHEATPRQVTQDGLRKQAGQPWEARQWAVLLPGLWSFASGLLPLLPAVASFSGLWPGIYETNKPFPPWAAFGRCFYHSNRKPTDTYWRSDPWDRRRDWCFRWSFDRHIHAINKYTQIHVQKESVIGGLYLHTDKGTTKQDLTLNSSGSDCDYQLGKGRSYRVYQIHPDVT